LFHIALSLTFLIFHSPFTSGIVYNIWEEVDTLDQFIAAILIYAFIWYLSLIVTRYAGVGRSYCDL
jgi:hypothetical protein